MNSAHVKKYSLEKRFLTCALLIEYSFNLKHFLLTAYIVNQLTFTRTILISFTPRTGKVVSPVKLILTPSKEGAEEPQEEILTLDTDEEEVSVKEKPPGLWVKELLLTEQSEDYDSGDDPEYVPPSVIYETDKEYDEVGSYCHLFHFYFIYF
jgi:hypothetical protein